MDETEQFFEAHPELVEYIQKRQLALSTPEPAKTPRYKLDTSFSLFKPRESLCKSLQKDLAGQPFHGGLLVEALYSAAADETSLMFVDQHSETIKSFNNVLLFINWLRLIDRNPDEQDLRSLRIKDFQNLIKLPVAKTKQDFSKTISKIVEMKYLDAFPAQSVILILAHGAFRHYAAIMAWLITHAGEDKLEFTLYKLSKEIENICPSIKDKVTPNSSYKERGTRTPKGITRATLNSVSTSNSTNSTYIVPVEKKSLHLAVLFDSGASASFIDEAVVKKGGWKTKFNNNRCFTLQFGTNEFSTVLYDSKVVTFEFELSDAGHKRHRLRHTFIVLRNLSEEVILGRDFLSKFNVHLDFSGDLPSFSILGTQTLSNSVANKAEPPAKVQDIQLAQITQGIPKEVLGGSTCVSQASAPKPDSLEHQMQERQIPEAIKKVLMKHSALFTAVDTLPPQRPTDYKINIDEKAYSNLPCRPLPKYNDIHRQFIDSEVQRLLEAGLIEPSTANRYAIPMVVPKPRSEKLRMVIDYRNVNKATIPSPTVFPPWETLSANLNFERFTTLDLTSGYNLLRVDPFTRQFTTFLTPRGKFQYKVLPFGLSEAPHVFSEFLSSLLFSNKQLQNVRQYMDDLLIPSAPDPETHATQLDTILGFLAQHELKLNFDKCHFFEESVDWVGHNISQNGIGPQSTSIETIHSIGQPTSKSDVKTLLGHYGYYQDHIASFASNTAHLSNLLQKNQPFVWTEECHKEFLHLKDAIVHQLQSFDSSKPCIICCDASKFAVGAVLLQESPSDSSILRPVAFRSRKFRAAERNWDIHEKEIFAVIFSLEKFQFYIDGRETTLFSDQSSIQDIFNNDSLSLSPKQQRWLARIGQFNVTIKHLSGTENVIADHLSRRPDFNEETNIDCDSSNNSSEHVVLHNIEASWSLADLYPKDPFITKVLEELPSRPGKFELHGGLLYHAGKLCIPQDALQSFLDKMHHAPLGGHIGTRRMLQRVRAKYFFPKLTEIVSNYVASCSTCLKVKPRNQLPQGLLELSPIPEERWSHINIDLITGLPEVSDPVHPTTIYDAILTVVDKVTSRCHFLPTHSTLSTQGVLQLLVHNIFKLHGFPAVVQSDRGPQFDNSLYREFLQSLGCEVKLGVSHHQQSNGKAERFNALIEDYLRCYVGKNSDWIKFISLGEFVINSAPSTSLGGISPFEADIGLIPNHPHNIEFPSLPDAVSLTEKLDRMLNTARHALTHAQSKYKEHFDARHKFVKFATGDSVYVDNAVFSVAPDAHTASLAPKLRSRFCGPFRISEALSDLNYRLELPPSSRANNVFHVSQLRLAKSIPESFFTAPTTPVVHKRYSDGSEEMEISQILGHQRKTKGYSMLVKFADNTEQWVRASALRRSAHELLEDYAKNAGISF